MDSERGMASAAYTASDEVQELVPVDFGPLFNAARGRVLDASDLDDGVECADLGLNSGLAQEL